MPILEALNFYEYRDCILKADGVSLSLGGVPVLRDLSASILDIYRPGCVTGRVIAILGPSGVGKTSLFHVLAGTTKPDAGTVTVGQKPVELGMVGVIAQNYPLFEHRTVLGNLTLAARSGGMSRSDATAKAMESLDRFDMRCCAALYPCQLSGGQRQRVAIAQQFLCSEHIVLMDEPFSGLDILAADEVCRMISELANRDELNTIVVVTHDIPAAVTVADMVWLLGRDRDKDGRPVPGSRIKATYNLAERGMAWRRGISGTKEFADMVMEIRAAFPSL